MNLPQSEPPTKAVREEVLHLTLVLEFEKVITRILLNHVLSHFSHRTTSESAAVELRPLLSSESELGL